MSSTTTHPYQPRMKSGFFPLSNQAFHLTQGRFGIEFPNAHDESINPDSRRFSAASKVHCHC
jgi:hypothetical protein